MTNRTAFTVLLLFLSCALAGIGSAAEPQMRPGYKSEPPTTPTVALTADQIRASAAIGTDVRDTNGATVATIGDLLINRKDDMVEAAILNPAGGVPFAHGKATVAWRSLEFDGKPTPHFVTRLSPQALASSTSFKGQAEDRKTYYDFKADLLGKQAIGADGKVVGKIQDVVLTFGDGHVVALVIDTGGAFDVGTRHRVVAWNKARPEHGKKDAPVRLAVTKAEVDAAPVIATMAPAPVPSESGSSTPLYRRDSTGNISGTRIPAPAERR